MRNVSDGFTVLETLIVLALAGVILAIAIQAIPTLERNSRNNQRRQDVQTILNGISHWELNNSGNLPTTAQLDGYLQQFGHLTYYVPPTSSNVTVSTTLDAVSGLVTLSPLTTQADLDIVAVYNHAKCTANPLGGASNTGAGYSDVVALYADESGTNSSPANPQCLQL